MEIKPFAICYLQSKYNPVSFQWNLIHRDFVVHPFCFLDNSVDVFGFPDVVSTSHSFEVPSYFHSITKKGSPIKLLIPEKVSQVLISFSSSISEALCGHFPPSSLNTFLFSLMEMKSFFFSKGIHLVNFWWAGYWIYILLLVTR